MWHIHIVNWWRAEHGLTMKPRFTHNLAKKHIPIYLPFTVSRKTFSVKKSRPQPFCLSVKASADCKSSSSHVFPEDDGTWVWTSAKKKQTKQLIWCCVQDSHRTNCGLAHQEQKREDLGSEWRRGYGQIKVIKIYIFTAMKKWTCLDIIPDYTARCPGGIDNLWPWEMWWQQHICDCREAKRDETRRCINMSRVCSKSRWLLKSGLQLHLSLSLGLMATRDPRSQIAPNWPATLLFIVTKRGLIVFFFAQDCR